MTDSAIIFILLIANALQFAFWSYQNQKLVNKVMSRSYHEYEQALKPVDKRGFNVTMPDEENMSMPDQTRIMDELTQRMI